MDYLHEQHPVHLIVYHIIWCPKRRRRIVRGEIAQRLEQIVDEVAALAQLARAELEHSA